MKSAIIIFALLLTTQALHAQTLYTKKGEISFYSKTSIENIEATNKKALVIWEVSTGKIEASVLMKGFEFEKALMQEHFNENYVESDKYPKATFKGTIENNNAISLKTDKEYTVKVTGALTIHGVTKQITAPAVITVKNGIISSSAKFTILLADYNIKIPSIVAGNISKQIAISIKVPAYAIK